MSEVQAAARHQQRVEELCVAAIRALAHERDLHFRGRRLHRESVHRPGPRRALDLYPEAYGLILRKPGRRPLLRRTKGWPRTPPAARR